MFNKRRTLSTVVCWLVMMLMGATLAGCGPTVAIGASNKDPNYQTRVKRVLVAKNLFTSSMTNTNKNALPLIAELKQSFDAKWAPLGITVELVDLDDAADKEQALAAATSRFNPTHVIELKTEQYITASYVIDGYTVDASLYDTALKKRVWRALVVFPPFGGSGRMRNGPAGVRISHLDDTNDLVNTLTAKLHADGLL